MTSADIPQVAAIHESSWAPHEISVKLGRGYLHLFYTNIVQSSYAFGYVYVVHDKIVGYATGFHDYQTFNASVQSKMRLRLGTILVKRLLARKVEWADVQNLLNDEKKLRKARYSRYHLGALALANEYKGTPIGKEAITATIGAVLEELESRGYPGCWGLCDSRNTPMRKYLLKLGFEELDTIEFIGKSVVLYEKAFKAPA
jgi:RimJ/RimL family protein N-acetyltransferase